MEYSTATAPPIAICRTSPILVFGAFAACPTPVQTVYDSSISLSPEAASRGGARGLFPQPCELFS